VEKYPPKLLFLRCSVSCFQFNMVFQISLFLSMPVSSIYLSLCCFTGVIISPQLLRRSCLSCTGDLYQAAVSGRPALMRTRWSHIAMIQAVKQIERGKKCYRDCAFRKQIWSSPDEQNCLRWFVLIELISQTGLADKCPKPSENQENCAGFQFGKAGWS